SRPSRATSIPRRRAPARPSASRSTSAPTKSSKHRPVTVPGNGPAARRCNKSPDAQAPGLFSFFAILLRGSARRVVQGVLDVAVLLLGLAFDLVLQALGFLRLVTDQLASFFLDLATDVLQFAFDLVLVHGDLLECCAVPMTAR